MKNFGIYYGDLELIEADMLNEYSIEKACKGVNYIIHTAAPY